MITRLSRACLMAASRGLSSSSSAVSMPVVHELERGIGDTGGDTGWSNSTVVHRSLLVNLLGFLATGGGGTARLMWGDATMPTWSCSCSTAAWCLRMAGDALIRSEWEKELKDGMGCGSLGTGEVEVEVASTCCGLGTPFSSLLPICSTGTTSGVVTEAVDAEDGVGEMLECGGVGEMLGGGGGGGGGGDCTLRGEAAG